MVGEVLLSAGLLTWTERYLSDMGILHTLLHRKSQLSLSRRGYGVLDIDRFGTIKQSVVLTLYDAVDYLKIS